MTSVNYRKFTAVFDVYIQLCSLKDLEATGWGIPELQRKEGVERSDWHTDFQDGLGLGVGLKLGLLTR